MLTEATETSSYTHRFNGQHRGVMEREQANLFGAIIAANRFALDHWRQIRGTPEHLVQINELSRGLDEMKARADAIPPELFAERRARHERAAALTEGASPLSQAAAVMDQFPAPPIVILDCDGTLTDQSKRLTDPHGNPFDFGLPVHVDYAEIPLFSDEDPLADVYKTHKGAESYLRFIPGSALAEVLLDKGGRERFTAVFTGMWREILRQHPQLFQQAGLLAPLRDGVDAFFANHTADTQMLVLSANFQPFVEQVMHRIPSARSIPTLGVTPDDLTVTDKASLIKIIAAQNPDSAVIFVGDGSSDMCVYDDPETRGVLAAVFALNGKSLHKHAQRHPDVITFAYDDFYDVGRVYQEMRSHAHQMSFAH